MYGQDQRKVGSIWPNKSSYSGINEVCEIDSQCNILKGKIFFGMCNYTYSDGMILSIKNYHLN